MNGERAERLTALDALRGLTVAAMIVVNNPGASDRVYAPLQHAEWNGCTLADLIFPFFLFITGTAITLAVRPATGAPPPYAKIARRTVVIFGLGLFLNGFPLFDWSVIRIPGVLQRIAICYGAAAFLVATTSVRTQWVTLLLIVIGYWMLTAMVAAPGAASVAGPETTLAAYIDRALLSGHLLHDDWDPEGVLSSVPAIATTLCGVVAGRCLRAPVPPAHRVWRLLGGGGLALAVGLLTDRWCPLNKSLWSSSYVVFTAGAAAVALGGCYWLIDVRGWRRWARPLEAYGTNALVAYVLSSLVTKELWLWQVARSDGSTVDAARYLFEVVFLPLARPLDASLLYAGACAVWWLVVMGVLYRRRVLIKI